MRSIFNLLYLFLFLGLGLASFFVLFHISRYALNKKVASFAALLFIFVTAVLLWTNAVLFFNLPLEELLPRGIYPYS
ncbi:MAG: hypothetical protein ABI747_00475 [Candidatus Moraniibacteriota bacterium]